jgi:hypothetical protein
MYLYINVYIYRNIYICIHININIIVFGDSLLCDRGRCRGATPSNDDDDDDHVCLKLQQGKGF